MVNPQPTNSLPGFRVLALMQAFRRAVGALLSCGHLSRGKYPYPTTLSNVVISPSRDRGNAHFSEVFSRDPLFNCTTRLQHNGPEEPIFAPFSTTSLQRFCSKVLLQLPEIIFSRRVTAARPLMSGARVNPFALFRHRNFLAKKNLQTTVWGLARAHAESGSVAL